MFGGGGIKRKRKETFNNSIKEGSLSQVATEHFTSTDWNVILHSLGAIKNKDHSSLGG